MSALTSPDCAASDTTTPVDTYEWAKASGKGSHWDTYEWAKATPGSHWDKADGSHWDTYEWAN
ncbi:MAG: hypothetical protein ACRDP1_15170 [Nocardioidaceae bacterium]